MDKESWRAVIHGVAQSRTWLSNWSELNWSGKGDSIAAELFQILKDDVVKVLHSIYQNLQNSLVATGLEKVTYIPIPEKGNAKKCSNYHTIVLISHARKVMLKILEPWLQCYMNGEIPDLQARFRKSIGTRSQVVNILWLIEKTREL